MRPAATASVLDEMAEAGYAGTELGDWGFMPTEPDALRAELDSRGLALLASFATPWLQDPARHRQGEDDAVKIAKLLAAVGGPETMIVLGNDPYGDPVRGKNAGRITPEMGLTTRGGRSTRMARTGWPAGCATRPASGPSSTSTWAP